MLATYFVNCRYLNDHLFGKELFIRFTASAFRKLPSIYVSSYFPFGFEGRMWDLIVLVPDHCLSFYSTWPFWVALDYLFTSIFFIIVALANLGPGALRQFYAIHKRPTPFRNYVSRAMLN